MKKTLLTVAVACLVFAFSSCSKSPAEQEVALYKEYTEQVQKVETQEEYNKFEEEFEAKMDAFKEANKDVEYTEEEETAIQLAVTEAFAEGLKKAASFK